MNEVAQVDGPCDFRPTQEELVALVKFLTREQLQTQWQEFVFAERDYGYVEHVIRQSAERIDQIRQVLGAEVVDETVQEAHEQFSSGADPRRWYLYLHGTDAERASVPEEFERKFNAGNGERWRLDLADRATLMVPRTNNTKAAFLAQLRAPLGLCELCRQKDPEIWWSGRPSPILVLTCTHTSTGAVTRGGYDQSHPSWLLTCPISRERLVDSEMDSDAYQLNDEHAQRWLKDQAPIERPLGICPDCIEQRHHSYWAGGIGGPVLTVYCPHQLCEAKVLMAANDPYPAWSLRFPVLQGEFEGEKQFPPRQSEAEVWSKFPDEDAAPSGDEHRDTEHA